MGRKFDKIDRIRGKDMKVSIDDAPDDLPRLRGCPVPAPILCSGKRSEATLDDGTLMECTNLACPFKEIPVHDSCFKAYEDHLVRTIGAMGSARGWTEAQRRSNLWEKKGQALVAKVGRCRCGQGLTRRDDDAFYAKEMKKQQEALLAYGVTGKKKVVKPRSKDLPKLNFAPVKTAPLTSVSEDRPIRQKVQRVTLSYRKRAPSTTSTVSHEEAWSRSDPFVEHDVILPPVPPRQTMSYALATRGDSSDLECEGSAYVYDDSGIDLKVGDSYATSDCSDLSKDCCSPVSSYDYSATESSNQAKEQVASIATPESSTKTCNEEVGAPPRLKEIQSRKNYISVHPSLENEDASGSSFYTPPISVPCHDTANGNRFSFTLWSPMLGCGFNLGESLLAAKYLPFKYQ